MTPARWKQVGDVFDAVLELPPDQRQSRARALCAPDRELESEVLRLVSLFERSSGFLDNGLFGPAAAERKTLCVAGDVVADRFVIVRMIATGGMGEVYEADDLALGQRVALKALRPDVGDPAAMERFRGEILLARKISHPSACRVHDAVWHKHGDGSTVIALTMELLEGETLADRLARGPLPEGEALRILRAVAGALGAAHAQHILHRDVKPSNIILSTDGGASRPVLTDFGLARASEAGTSHLTGTGLVIGTPQYLAPEQMSGNPPSEASDVYALALIAYEMVSGRRPHEGQLSLRLVAPPPPVTSLVHDLPARWGRVLTRALEPDPTLRYRSPNELVDALTIETPVWRTWSGLGTRLMVRARLATAVAITMALFSGASRLIEQEAPIVPAASRLLLIGVTNGTADPDLDGVSELLRSQLAQSARFELVRGEAIRATLGRMRLSADTPLEPAVARDVALRQSAPMVIYGVVTRLGDDYSLSVRLERVADAPSMIGGQWTRSFKAPTKGDLFEAVHDAGRWIRETVGETSDEIARLDRPPEDTTTSSWRALRPYIRAQTLAAEGKQADAVLMLEEAIRFDPSFATAHRRLGDLLLSMRRDRDAFVAWQEAVRLTDQQQLTNREALRTRSQYLEDAGDLAGAEKAYRTYLLHYPQDQVPTLFLGSVLMDQGRSAEALPWFHRAVDLRPDDFVARTHMTRALLDLGRNSEAAEQIARLRAIGAVEWATWLDGLTLFLKGDVRGALAVVEPLRESSDRQWLSRAFAVRASWLAELEEHPAAIAELMDGVAFDATNGFLEREADKWLFIAALRCRRGELTECVDAGNRAMAVPSPLRTMRAGSLMARSGRVAEAERLLATFRNQPDIPRARAAMLRLTGEIHLARRRTTQALAAFEAAAALSPARFERLSLAAARRAAGNAEGARLALADYVQHPVRAYFTPEPELPGIWTTVLREYTAALDAAGLDATPYRSRMSRSLDSGRSSRPFQTATYSSYTR